MTNEQKHPCVAEMAELMGRPFVQEMYPYTLREWFAGQALVGILASVHTPEEYHAAQVAIECYEMADAMMEARK